MKRRAAAALVVALLAGACSSSDDATTIPTTRPRADAPITTLPGDPPVAVVIGDSNTFLAASEIEPALAAPGFTPVVRGISGSGVKDNATDWLPAAAAIVAARPAVVVVALGTNDALVRADVEAFQSRLDELLVALGPLPVVWVTHTEGGEAHDPADERRVNDVIRAAPAAHPNLTVLDLAPLLAARPNLLDDDRLHYSERGRAWFGERIADAAATRATAAATTSG